MAGQIACHLWVWRDVSVNWVILKWPCRNVKNYEYKLLMLTTSPAILHLVHVHITVITVSIMKTKLGVIYEFNVAIEY